MGSRGVRDTAPATMGTQCEHLALRGQCLAALAVSSQPWAWASQAGALMGCAVTGAGRPPGLRAGSLSGDREQTSLCSRAGGRSGRPRLAGEEEAWE